MHPCIMRGQVCIGAFGRIEKRLSYESGVGGVSGTVLGRLEGGQAGVIVEKMYMPVSFSGDHRVLDGATLARFVQLFKYLVENPERALVRMR